MSIDTNREAVEALKSKAIVSPGKVIVYTWTPERGNMPAVCETIEELLDAIKAELPEMEVGDELFIKVHEMTPREIEELPDHPGW